jgi:hypothetical protein
MINLAQKTKEFTCFANSGKILIKLNEIRGESIE